MIPGGCNRQKEASNYQQNPGSVKGTSEEEMFPSGWNSQIETSNTEYYTGPVQSALEKKEMIPDRWNSHRESANKNIILAMLKTTWRRKG